MTLEESMEEPIENSIDTLATLSTFLDDLVLQQSKMDFISFVRLVAPTIVSDWKMGRHIKLISDKLQKVKDGEIKRLMVFLPPRSSKSVICSKIFPAWYIGNNPQHEVLTISHSDQLASDFGRSVRDIVNTEQFQEVFPGVSLRSDVRAAGKWKTNQNGTYYAAGVRSQIAGRGAHIAILDDAMSEEDSFSEAGRRYIKEWYPAGLRTRIMPGGAIVIINTRYHHDDLCGWLLKQEEVMDMDSTYPWEVVKIPAWIDEEASELLDLPVGSSYFPEWKPDEVLRVDEEEIIASNGSRYWESLYMQNPTPEEGGIIKKRWIERWEYIQTWGIFDMPEEDYDGVESWGSNLILLGSTRGKFEYPDLRRISQELYNEYRPDVCIIEKKASGQSLIQDLRRSGLPVMDYTPDRDKVSRVYAASPMLEAGRVWLPSNKRWADDLMEELITFPHGRHDDQVDALVMAVHYMRESWRLGHPDDPNWEDDENPRRQKRVGYWRT